MGYQQTLLACLFLAYSFAPSESIPDSSGYSQQSRGSYSSSSNTLSSGNGFTVSLAEANLNGKCVASLNIFGNGISKVLDYPCNTKPHSIINLQRTLLVDDEYYTDTPGVMVRLYGGGCVQETFLEQAGQFTSRQDTVSDAECEKIRVKISLLKQQQVKWSEWYTRVQQSTLQQLQALQNNLAALQAQVLNGAFGFFG